MVGVEELAVVEPAVDDANANAIANDSAPAEIGVDVKVENRPDGLGETGGNREEEMSVGNAQGEGELGGSRQSEQQQPTHPSTASAPKAVSGSGSGAPNTAAVKQLSALRKLCEETDREWRKNIKRKICDVAVVADQIADQSIELLREHNLKGVKGSNVPASLCSSEIERMSKDESVQLLSKERLANAVNKVTLMVLEKLMNHKWSWLFNEPVDADQLNLTDYHTIVKKPMALSTVKSRAQMGTYKTALEAASEIRLVFHNAQLYNKPGTDVNIMASALLEKFEDLWHAKMTQKLAEEEALSKQEETNALKKRADTIKAQQNSAFRKKCLTYEKLLCDVEHYLVDVQHQVIVSCKPMSPAATKRAEKLFRETPFEKMKPALAVILQRYPEMLNSITREVEVDLSKVDSLTLRQVLHLLESAQESTSAGNADGEIGDNNTGSAPGGNGSHVFGRDKRQRGLRDDLSFWVDTMSSLVSKQKRRRRRHPGEQNLQGENQKQGNASADQEKLTSQADPMFAVLRNI
eukprot:CAMPEP_0198243266 /NCGR_PEP_ID=MMETSP1446-20131203/26170_1 /TAXON_ID=1461542 ORGANISM="Unidentified sp, Strain CCMP2111" /NCGR_SAMPLE_ID=MMETSP1446 /ASSEMBLY_ACC=CAM_ASM_001112 /LENGTH=521 /DNA_ID=CAMNT_0043927043 /DNA_START=18 /DNA_END=1584 /DNA_ORIENTATION=+